tara:strand:+ start:1491 stop:1709 length:219 start_codon:yes stop_codon:yes gene_type:complete
LLSNRFDNIKFVGTPLKCKRAILQKRQYETLILGWETVIQKGNNKKFIAIETKYIGPKLVIIPETASRNQVW